ncbi:MAG: PAS domain S-box protein [bacterium]
MSSPTPTRRFARRYSVAVLAVIAVAVGTLGLLVAQTSRHSIDGARMNVAGHQRVLSERLVAQTLLARSAPPDERELWRPRIDATVNELRIASQQLRGVSTDGVVIPQGTRAADEYEALIALQDSVKEASARAATADASSLQVDSLLAQQRRLAVAIEHVVDELEKEWSRQVDHLLQLEAACVILLLIAMVLGVRLALQPTQAQLSATVSALAESESRIRAVLDAMPDGMLLTNRDGQIELRNPSALRILDLATDASPADVQSLAGQLTDERGAPLHAEGLPSRITMRTGESLTDVIIATRGAHGDTKFLSAHTSPLYRGDSTEPHAAVTIFRDVTLVRRIEEERQAQAEALAQQNEELLSQAEALERGEALFRSLVETAGSAIVGLDIHGSVFEWNREAEMLYGVPRANAIGVNYAEKFVTSPHRHRMREGIASVLHGKPIRNLLGPVKSTSGERHVVLWNITALRGGIGEPAHGLIAAGLDVTEREASDERFRMLFERSTDAHMLYDAEGIIDCNDATLRMLRAPNRDRLMGRRPAELSPHRQPDGRLSVVVAGQMRARARITGYHRFEWTHLRHDGTQFQVEVTLTPMRMHSREVILAVWHDITERKAVEDALRMAKDAAESANKTKSEFMTRMNHELRTPLTAIIGFSNILLKGRKGPLTPEAQIYAERILDNGMHLLSVINQILDVAKVEAGHMEIDREKVAVDTLVKETLAMLESTAEAKGLVLRRDIPTRVSSMVTDRAKLRQILINLVGNAIKFTSKGEVLVRVVTDSHSGTPREIVVRDTGIGIPVDRQAKIFDPFEQGDSSTRRKFGGTGLGLSIVKTFAQLIGSTVDVESEVGVGTTFTVRLPLADPGQEVVSEALRGADAVPSV